MELIVFSGRRNLMKRNFYRLTVLCMLVSTIFMSGCEGLNPVADMAKIQAENAKSQREAEATVKVAEIDSQTAIKLAEIEAKKAENERIAAELNANSANNPNDSGTITLGTDSESTAAANTTADQSSVGSTSDNDKLAD